MDPSKKTIYIVAAIAFIALLVGIYFLFIFHKSPKKVVKEDTSSEVKKATDLDLAKRPYVTLTPTSDGAEIIISVENMGFFDKIEYELTYQADNPQVSGQKIQRGATGTDVNTKDEKYKKSILLGTASRGVRSPDTGITDGKLTMHLFKGETEYLSETNWDLFKTGLASSKLSDKTGNFNFGFGPLGKNYWVVIADTVGLPPGYGFDAKKVIQPIYGIFSVAPQFKNNASASVTFTRSATKPQLNSFTAQDSKWVKTDSKFDASTKTLSASVASFGTFVVVSQ